MAGGKGQTGDPDAYSGLLTTYDLPELQEQAYRLSTLLDLDLKPQLASKVRRAYLSLVSDLKQIAREIAVDAEEAIKRAEADSRVRPDTEDTGEPKLEDHLGFSRALDAVPGSVGINFEPELYDNVPWWWTNEEGYSGHVGRVVHGFFYDAGFENAAAPSQQEFRQHPIFDPGPSIDEDGTLFAGAEMKIERPIPERRFVEHGFKEAEAAWHARVDSARARFNSEVSQVIAAMQTRRRRP